MVLQECDPRKHTIDVMHIEKNICDSLLKFLSGEKDSNAVRNDMQARGIRPNLWLQPQQGNPNVVLKYHAPYVCTPPEWNTFLSRLSAVRVPTGYAGAFAKHVRENKLGSMKTHDFHVMMQQVMVVCLRGLMQKPIRRIIFRLSDVFSQICAKVWDPTRVPQLKEDVAHLLCDFEVYFPPAFFDVMTHLLIHVVEDIELFGPVTARWMYPLERFMKLLKGHVHRYYNPEASMAMGYMKDETLGYITEYMAEFEGVRTRVWNSEEEEGVGGEVLRGAPEFKQLSIEVRNMAHRYVLLNMDIMQPWWE